MKTLDFTKTAEEWLVKAMKSLTHFRGDNGTARKHIARRLTRDFPDIAKLYINTFIEHGRKLYELEQECKKGGRTEPVYYIHEFKEKAQPHDDEFIDTLDLIIEEILKRMSAYNKYCNSKLEDETRRALNFVEEAEGFEMMPDSLIFYWWIDVLLDTAVKMQNEIYSAKSYRYEHVHRFDLFFKDRIHNSNKTDRPGEPFRGYYDMNRSSVHALKKKTRQFVIEFIYAQSYEPGRSGRTYHELLFEEVRKNAEKVRKPLEKFLRNIEKINKIKEEKQPDRLPEKIGKDEDTGVISPKKVFLIKGSTDELIKELKEAITPRAVDPEEIEKFALDLITNDTVYEINEIFGKLKKKALIGALQFVSIEMLSDLFWHTRIVKNWEKLDYKKIKKYLEEE